MKKRIIILGLIIIGIGSLIGIYFSYSIRVKEFSNTNFKIKYDSTWKVISEGANLKLEHKKSGSVFEIQCKVLDDNYIDTKLEDLTMDILDSIEKQNEGYYMIDNQMIDNKNYEGFSYLYEKDMEQALVNLYKKDNKLVIVYYVANSEYYDIVLDSVDTMLESLEILTGEKVN